MSSVSNHSPEVLDEPRVFVRTRKPRLKSRSARIVLQPSAMNPFWVIKITETFARGSKADHYAVEPMHSDFGRAFHVRKLGLDYAEYDVLLHGPKSTCECLGFLRHGHCRHIECLTALVSNGKLEPATAPLEATVAA